MIVFLVGGESRLMDALITKMEKDGHKTYLLSGKRWEEESTAASSNGINFPYDSESVREIFTNVNPVLLFFSELTIPTMTGVMPEESRSVTPQI